MPTSGSALRSPIPSPRVPGPRPPAAGGSRSVDAVLRDLPSHGWTSGWIGRRDRALLVLARRAELPATAIAELTVGDIDVREGRATVRPAGADPVVLRRADDCLLCGPCALARWLHALDLAGSCGDGRVVASVIGRAAPLGPHSPHVCESDSRTAGDPAAPVFPPDDRWGITPAIRASLPEPARPGHDTRHRAAYATRMSPPIGRSHPGPARPDGPTRATGTGTDAGTGTATADHPTLLDGRVRALLSGLV